MSSQQMNKITTSMKSLQVSDKSLVGKMDVGTAGTKGKVRVNAFSMRTESKYPFYKYDVNIVLTLSREPQNIEVSLVHGKKNDSELRRIKNEATNIFEYVKNNNRGFFKGLQFYNCMAVLITTQKLDIRPGETKSFPYPVQNYGLDRNTLLGVHFQIKCVRDEFEINPQIECTARLDRSNTDLRLLEALNQVVQHCTYNREDFIKYKNNVIYLMDPQQHGFGREATPPMTNRNDIYIGIGQNGAVKTLGGSGGHRLYFVTDMCKSLFHADHLPLINKIESILNIHGIRNNDSLQNRKEEVLAGIKGLEVYRQYGRWARQGLDTTGRFVIGDIGPPAREIQFEVDGNTVNMVTYFREKHQVNLQYPHLFTIVPRTKSGKKSYLPVEVLNVGPDQRVTLPQMTSSNQRDMVMACAVLPSARVNQITLLNQATGVLNPQNGTGITFEDAMATVNARTLPEPAKLVADKGLVFNKNVVDIHNNSYHIAAKVPNMGFIVIGERLDSFNAGAYKNRLFNIAKKKGMKFSNDPEVITYGRTTETGLEKVFKNAKERRMSFLLFVVQDNYNLHSHIKKFEQQYQILTQEVRLSKAIRNQTQTEHNVVNKMNVKNGGLNYRLNEIVDKNLLILGFTTSRSTASDKIGVVGYSFNGMVEPCGFIGGYKYVKRGEKDKEIFSQVMEEVLVKAITQTQETRKVDINKVVIYINGLSDGLLSEINELYNKKIRAALVVCKKPDIKFSTIAVSRSHLERFFDIRKSENVAAGTVIDDTVVSPVFTEFFLNAHIAIKGTSKTPKYTLMSDSIRQSFDRIQQMTYALCCLHQIIYTNTSLPAPVVIADRYATRGSANCGRLTDDRNVEQMNATLTYDNKILNKLRFTA